MGTPALMGAKNGSQPNCAGAAQLGNRRSSHDRSAWAARQFKRSHSCLDENLRGSRDAGVFFSDRDSHWLQTRFSFRASFKSEQVLIFHVMQNVLEERLERYRRSESDAVKFAAGRIRQLREKVLRPSSAPEAMAKVPDAGAVNGVDDDTGFLRRLNARVDIRVIGRKAAPETLDATADHN